MKDSAKNGSQNNAQHARYPASNKYSVARRALYASIALGLLLALSACSTTSFGSGQTSMTTAHQSPQKMQQQLTQAKRLFINKQYTKAVALLFPLARQGYADAQYSIGYLYHYGYGLPRNEKESIRWIATAAARGHLLAQKALAQINASHDQQGVSAVPVPSP